MRPARFLLTCLLTASVLGCRESQVADDLAQRDANRIVAELRSRGIEAVTSKERGAKGRYSVSVPSSRFGDAAMILNDLGLPGEAKPSFADLVAASGILPSSREVEAMRLDRASAAEVESLLAEHPAVVSVGAIVRMRSLQGSDAPSVSVIIQKREGSALDELAVRDIVLRSVPGMKPEALMVTIAEQRPAPTLVGIPAADSLVPFLVFWRVPQEDYGGLSILLLGLLAAISGLAALGGYIFGQYNLSRHTDALRLEAIESTKGDPEFRYLDSRGERNEDEEDEP